MTNTEIIIKLKRKDLAQPFGLLNKEEQEVLKKAGKNNLLWLTDMCVWISPVAFSIHPNNISTYILKPDYEPEPEYVDIEITDIVSSIESGKPMQVCVIRENKRIFARFRKP